MKNKIIISSKKDIIEKLAELEHKQWMEWAKGILKEENITKERKDRWEKECFKPYKDLEEKMKEFDREWARKAYKIMKEDTKYHEKA